MLGPRHLPTSIQLHNYESDLQKHHKKLEQIHNDRKKKPVDKDTLEMSKLFETRAKGLKFHINEKAQQIEKDNELLLGKLVEISRKKKNTLSSVKSEGALPKTLHAPSRKREKDRIAAENEAFARRLLSQQPSFDRKKLETDYEKHNARVKNMQRLIGFSPRKIKLPPLHKDDFDTNKKSTTVEKKDNKQHDKKAAKKTDKIAEDEKEYATEEDETRENEELAKKKENEEKERKEQEEKAAKEQKEKEDKAALEKAAQQGQSQKDIPADQQSKQDVVAHSPAKSDAKDGTVSPDAKAQSTVQASQKDIKDAEKIEDDIQDDTEQKDA